MLVRPLVRELAVLIALKVAALALLFALFFAPVHRPDVDDDAVARALLSRGEPSEAGP